jgi:Ni/Fe-hydrogenase subunit HybB-like protein
MKKEKYLLFINKYFLIFASLKTLVMSKTNNFVFWGLYVIAWIIFVGLSIEAGGLIVNFFFHLYNPEMVQNLYQKLDLIKMYQDNESAFFGIYSFILTQIPQ